MWWCHGFSAAGAFLPSAHIIAAIVHRSKQAAIDSLLHAQDLDELLETSVVANMSRCVTDVFVQRHYMALLQELFATGTRGASKGASTPSLAWVEARPEPLRRKVWEVAITAMHLYSEDPVIQLEGAKLMGLLSPTMPDSRRVEARIVCKHAWHLFEARKERAHVKTVVDAMAVTKPGACSIQ